MLIEYQEAHSGYGQRLGLLALGVWLSGAAFLVGVLAVEGASAGNAAPITIQSTMDSAIDPSADALWASVGTVETQRGTAQRAPQSAAEWGRLLGHAQTLITGARQLQRPGLAVGGDGHSPLADASVPGTRTAVQIRADIDRDPARFVRAAQRLEAGGRQALAAITARNPERLIAAGAAIDAACEACHAAYWYPRGKPLSLPPVDRFDAVAGRP
ncbi:hypothetical protein EJC47_13530 [Sphingomonas sp. TF3]|uniref:hypothetical protein n=1 Tax=Sphingomonas sp. TF3 TaxID=2495580 RepID=UPI000F87ECCA|nr:hypothetical protein [Sphingomonas sp. TF3]RUN75938.1 hypothetical protein EJC47_13530 [Sphingomonas sp. TF3]